MQEMTLGALIMTMSVLNHDNKAFIKHHPIADFVYVGLGLIHIARGKMTPAALTWILGQAMHGVTLMVLIRRHEQRQKDQGKKGE